jgi:peptidoglycan/xylan/chitin deacetylase (PgdA/CDA1 family)
MSSHLYDIHAGGRETHPPEGFTWPGGHKIGVVFRMAYEWWSGGHWPGIGPMGNPLKAGTPDLNAIGWAEYGHRRGVHRVLEVFERFGVKASILVCGIMAERYPQEVRRIAEAGHDIVAHSYAMDVIPAYLDEAAEVENIRRTTGLIADAIGHRPAGWISPRSTPSPRTARLLAQEGYQWHSDTLNDDLPYRVDFGDTSIVAVPGTMEVNDLPLFMRHGQPPRVMVEIFEDWLAYARQWETRAIKIDPTVHAHVFGRPAGTGAFHRILEIATSAPDVWVGTRSQMVDHFLHSLQAGGTHGSN